MITKELVKNAVRTKRFAVVVSSVISVAGGAFGGFSIAKKHLETKYAEISEREIREAKLFYQQKNKTGDFSDPTVLVEKYEADNDNNSTELDPDREMVVTAVELLKKRKYVQYDKPPQTQEEKIAVTESIHHNVFNDLNEEQKKAAFNALVDEPEEFDVDDELDKKAEGRPYILEYQEFEENENDHSQSTLTYYEEDDVLVDDRDQPITNVQGVIGVENLKFGYGSNDKNVVYICNPRFNADYEVVRSNGSYAEIVLGFIQHSDKRPPRKFRIKD